MKKFNLSESLNLVGLWRLPDDENVIPGILSYSSSKGIRLKLEGQFKTQEFKSIFGVAGGHQITLLDAFSISFSPFAEDFGGYYPAEIVANQMLIGGLFKSENDISIEEVIIETSDIKAWTLLSGFSGNIKNDFKNRRFSVDYELPKPVILYENNDIEIKIITKVSMPSSFPPSEEVVFKEINFFQIKNKKNTIGLSFFSHIDAIRKLISLATRQEIDVKNICFKTKENEEYIHCIAGFVDVSLDYKSRSYHPHHMFFTLQDKQHNIKVIYEKWYNFLENSPEPINLYFCKCKRSLHDIFLTKAQALEEIHRKLNPEKDNFGYKSIINYLFEKHRGVMSYVGEKEKFASLVLNHRDYFSHWFEKKKGLVLNGLELDYLSRDVNLLLELCLLEIMGFNENEIQLLIENCFDYRGYLDIDRPDGENIQPKRRLQWS